MPAEAFAAMSAVAFAASHVVTKRGLRTTSVVAGTTLLIASAWGVVLIAVLFDPPEKIRFLGTFLFAVSGVFAPGIARFASTTAVKRLGPSISVPIQTGARPLLALVGAMALLGEEVGPLRFLGILLVAGGAWHLSREESTPKGGVASRDDLRGRWAARRKLRPDIVFPIVAAISLATADVLIKEALNSVPDPVFGTAVAIGAGFLIWITSSITIPAVRDRFQLGADAWWFLLAGALVAIGILALFYAFDRGDVTVVTPIASSQPLVVFLFSALFLRDLERVRRDTVFAGIAVVAGAIMVSTT